MNPSNILYVPNRRGQIIPTVIDYDIALGRDHNIGKRIPLIYTLPHINQDLPRDFWNAISSFSETKLTRIMEIYKKASPKERASEFTSQDKEKLLERLNLLKTIANTEKPKTLKEMMLALIERRSYSEEDIFLSQASGLVGATLLSPLKFSKFKHQRPTKSAKNLGNIHLFNLFNTVNVPTFRLPWIFEVTQKGQLSSFPDKDYIPLKEVRDLYKELTEHLKETKEEDSWPEDSAERFLRDFRKPKQTKPRQPNRDFGKYHDYMNNPSNDPRYYS